MLIGSLDDCTIACMVSRMSVISPSVRIIRTWNRV